MKLYSLGKLRHIHYKTRYMLLCFALIVLITGGVNYAFMMHSQGIIIQHEAIRIAEVATAQALTSRSVYTQAVADKLIRDGYGPHASSEMYKGFIPLPAQFLKLVGLETTKNGAGLYSYAPLSKWNLEPTQGLGDDFQREAWAQLETQDQTVTNKAIDWKPVWRYDRINGIRTLRYMRADPAANASCVNCHNNYEKRPEIIARRIADGITPGKQWKQHQLMGAIEVKIPVDKIESIAARQEQITLAVTLLTSICGLASAAWLAVRNVKQERQATEYFETRSKVDPLTQLGNRAFFNERAEAALNRAKRTKTKLGLMFIDLDRFKPINDTYGHNIGDLVLKEISRRLVQTLRVTDIISRQGGDEFLIVLESLPIRENLDVVAKKLLSVIAAPIQVNNMSLTVSASIGISIFPDHGTDLATLIEKADAAMYQAKQQGKDNFQFWRDEII